MCCFENIIGVDFKAVFSAENIEEASQKIQILKQLFKEAGVLIVLEEGELQQK